MDLHSKHEKGSHLFVGIFTKNASRYTCKKKLLRSFPEFEDTKISVKCYNGWGRICYVITQVDKNPTVWGELSIQDINNTAKAHKDHRKAIRRTEDKVLEDRYDIHDDEEIREKSQLLDCVAAIPEITESLPMSEELLRSSPLSLIALLFPKWGKGFAPILSSMAGQRNTRRNPF